MGEPVRIQLSRRKGWQMPDNAVKVDRTTPFGNPYAVAQATSRGGGGTIRGWVCGMYFTKLYPDKNAAAQMAVITFRAWITHPANAKLLAAVRHGLRGKDLACWCKPGEPCHADVLLELANKPEPPQ